MGHIVLGILFCVAGIAITFGANWILRQFGGVEEAEKYMRFEGGSRFFYKLVGIFTIFIGFLILGNIHTSILNWLAQTFFGGMFNK